MASQEEQTLGTRIVCTECGLPKTKKHFKRGSVICSDCTELPSGPDRIRALTARINDDPVERTKDLFNAAIAKMRNSRTPTIAGGVVKAHNILNASSTVLLARSIKQNLKIGKRTEYGFAAADPHLLQRQLELLQKAEQQHDELLTSKGDALSELTPEDMQSILISQSADILSANPEFRQTVLSQLYKRVPTFLEEVMAVAKAGSTATVKVMEKDSDDASSAEP